MTDTRFYLICDDIVVDCTTGLSWSRGNIGTELLTWSKAADACRALDLGGFKDWRLPTVEELFLLADRTRHSPAIDTTFFPDCKSDWYWTSTPAAFSPGVSAWLVAFGYGDSYWNGQRNDCHVRAVRSTGGKP